MQVGLRTQVACATRNKRPFFDPAYDACAIEFRLILNFLSLMRRLRRNRKTASLRSVAMSLVRSIRTFEDYAGDAGMAEARISEVDDQAKRQIH